ncbi:BatA domain-containing protein [Thalassoroseus pseudoceratinae]|uniref:BatA domain-containing protein n=1 Tax=Thalassoroseus pseudoceratinae TaxID=2713176 RepID=UPI00141F9ECA|nr:BatA domain-containing protein [Thalassoroseus pseudoceratinae]
MTSLAQFFLNPTIAAIGGVLVLAPIIIHLINRVRYRRVKFAAMEFLLEAQQRNRRRLLMEQLLLLLLRILIVLALAALLGRLVLDARLSVFSGNGKAHHLVLLDDSASMQTRVGNTTAFEDAKKVIRQLVEEGSRRPGTQQFSMILLSELDALYIAQQDVDENLLSDLEDKLDSLECSFQRLDIEEGIEIAGQKLKSDRAIIKHLHVLSDFRSNDWQGDPSLGKAVQSLSDDGVTVNLIRASGESSPNLGIVQLDADVQAAAVGVPVRFSIGVQNYGNQVAEDVRLSLSVDGEKLPLAVAFDKIEAGETITQVKDITFQEGGLHRIRVDIASDSLSVDNDRFLTINVPLQNNVLIVSNDINGEAEDVLRFALAPDPALTGISPRVESVDFLRTNPLSSFRSIYILDHDKEPPENGTPITLPPDAIEQLEAYVRDGGGLVWAKGMNADADIFNAIVGKWEKNNEGKWERDGESLFPVPLADSRSVLTHDDPTSTSPDLLLEPHAISENIADSESQMLNDVRVDQYIPVAEDWEPSDDVRLDGVTTIGRLKNGAPVLFEHQFGRGRVVTLLTSAGPPWTNLAERLAFLPLIQQIQKFVAKPDEILRQREIGTPIRLDFPALDYDQKIDFLLPGSGEGRAVEYDMKRVSPEPTEEEAEESSDEPDPNADRFVAEYLATNTPGIYGYRARPRLPNLPKDGAFAYNVSRQEGHTSIASTEELRKTIGETDNVFVREYGETDYISQGVDPGREMRNYLLYLLIGLLIIEQTLAYRFSYHPETGAKR